MPTPESPAPRHGHKTDGAVAEAACPYCGQLISRKAYEKIRCRIEQEERARIGKIERALKDHFAREQQQAAAKAQVEIAKAKKDATAAAQAQIKALRNAQEATIAQRVQVARKDAEKKLVEVVAAEREKRISENLKHQQELETLRRRIAKERPMDLGDEAEIDILALLTRTAEENSWSLDEFTRFGRGKAGGDILHKIVLPNGVIAGTVLFESKNTSVYQNKWTVKMRADQISIGADHSILVTTAWPTGERDLMVRDSVLVVSKSRLAAVATWLRGQTIRAHSLSLSNQQRLDKAGRLYTFMCSDKVTDRWERLAKTTMHMKDALRLERNQHEKAWADRIDQMDVLNTIRESFIEDLDSIFEATEVEAV